MTIPTAKQAPEAGAVKTKLGTRANCIANLLRALVESPDVAKEPLVTQNQIINSAVALSIGNYLDIPTVDGIMPNQYYQLNELDTAHQLVSMINELIIIDYKTIIPMIYPVWYTRYTIARGDAGLPMLAKIMEHSKAATSEHRKWYDDLSDVMKG